MWERVSQSSKASGVALIGIGLLDNKDACQAFVKRHHLTFPNGYDKDGTVAKHYGFTYQPFWAVIDKEGTLLRTGYGPRGEDELASAIKQLSGK